MDKLKPIIKHHFWILCGVVVATGIGVGVWSWMAAGELINKQKSAIVSAEDMAKRVLNVKAEVEGEATVVVHPNQDTLAGMKLEIDAGREEVLKAWQRLYDAQKDLLGWPGGVVNPQFARHFDGIRAERVEFTTGKIAEEVSEQLRKQIRRTFPAMMPHLANSIRAKFNEADVTGEVGKSPKAVDSTKAADDMENLLANQPLVDWSLGDQIKWYGRMTNFKGNGNNSPDGTPTTLQILYLKEDMVLLNGVLEIVKAANQNAAIPSQAAVSEIASIMIGKEAHEAKPIEVGGGGGEGTNYQDEQANRMKLMQDAFKASIGGGVKADAESSDSTIASFDPANLRYVDKDFVPIPAPDYRSAVKAGDLSEKSWMAVVKRVPVRLRLKVDERQIPAILENCANGKIPLEVRQITLIGGELPKDPAAAVSANAGAPTGVGDPAAANSSGGGSSAKMDLDAGSGGGSGGGAAGAGGSGGQTAAKTFSSPEFNAHFMVPLEIYGIMKIYNEPSAESLGKSSSQDGAL